METSVNDVKQARFVVEASVNDYVVKAEVNARNGKTKGCNNGTVTKEGVEVATFEYSEGYNINYSNIEADNAAIGVAVQEFVKSIKDSEWSISVIKA